MIYFDHNATSPLIPEARRAWLDAHDQFIGNPSSPHRLGSRAEAALDGARERLARILVCDPGDIVWTSGATESNNLVVHHFARTLPTNREVWLGAVEHPCLLEPAKAQFSKRCRLIPVTTSGVVDLDWIEAELKQRQPGLIGVMAANNETGVLQPWSNLANLCRRYEVPFFCDAAQWMGKLPGAGLGACDFVSGCAHKFGGPKGVGFLKCPPRGAIIPMLVGGGQEQARRAGTENVPGVLAMIAALESRETMIPEVSAREVLRDKFEARLVQELPGSRILGGDVRRLWNTVSAVLPDAGSEHRWVVKLDKDGFATSTGSACASGKEKPSHVLAAMGVPDREARRVLRFSSAWETNDSEWNGLADALAQVYRQIVARTSSP